MSSSPENNSISPNRSYNNLSSTQSQLDEQRRLSGTSNHKQYLNNADKQEDVVIFIDLYNFKTQQCKLQYQHNPKKCFYYHEAKKDRRRPLGTYTSEICPYIQNGAGHYECPNGDNCTRSHNRVEEFYHPEKYKVKFCQTYPDRIENCDYGDMCAFAHSLDEVTVDLLDSDKFEKNSDFYMFHFKTVWCPYSDT